MKRKIPLIESVAAGDTAVSNAVRSKLRRRPVEEKRRIVEETFAEGVSVASVARRHDLNANLVFRWLREYRKGKLGHGTAVQGFIPVGVVDGNAVLQAPPVSAGSAARGRSKTEAPAVGGTSCWPVEVELRNGVKVRIGCGVDERDVRRALLLARELA